MLGTLTLADPIASKSATYGPNDPFSLPFIAELAAIRCQDVEKSVARAREELNRAAESQEASESIEELKRKCEEAGNAATPWLRVQEFLREQANRFLNVGPRSAKLFSGRKKNEVITNAVIPLKAAQLIKWMLDKPDLHHFLAYFERTLHEHLSFSSIPDSRFDPAELAFALEGLLICQTNAVDPTLFGRVVEVLEKAQQESAFWRPAKPFMAQERGWSLFPVSVEVANSLLRSCDLFDASERREAFGSTSIDLFRRYWQWLRARTMRFKAGEVDCVGWHSEHINETGTIHVWSTSQVLEFLIGYRHLLQTHIARTTLIASRFKVDRPAKFAKPWHDIVREMEPVSSLDARYAVYDRIGIEFISSWRDGTPNNYSMLLYGPPGTGKTTVAEEIARALGRPFITITVSDFLGAGGGEVEARAKAIFDVLLSQPECVVLFDEIDAFLLDRDSDIFGKQETVFQFMTPGMLTKLNDLRRSERLIFVVATNYENRIDLAIKRTGRIDQNYLVLPPDAAARERMLRDLLRRSTLIAEDADLQIGVWDRLARASIFLGYKDMEATVKKVAGRRLDVARLEAELSGRARTTSLSSYRIKFSDPRQSCPYEEFLCLVAMLIREAPESPLRDEPTLLVVRDGLTEVHGGSLDHAIAKVAPSLPEKVRSIVVDALGAVGQTR